MTPLPIDQAYAEITASNPVLVRTLVSLNEWINHWRDDVAGGLQPTIGSLNDAQAEIVRALASHGNDMDRCADDLRAASAIATNHARIVSLTGGVHG